MTPQLTLKVVFKQLRLRIYCSVLISENNGGYLNSRAPFENRLVATLSHHQQHVTQQDGALRRGLLPKERKHDNIASLADMLWLIITCRYRKQEKDGL